MEQNEEQPQWAKDLAETQKQILSRVEALENGKSAQQAKHIIQEQKNVERILTNILK